MTQSVYLPPNYRLVAFDNLDSSNEEAKRQALSGAASGLVVWAQSQSAGRGRRGRTWISPQGGLYFSILLRPKCSPAQAAQISFVSALAVAEGIRPGLRKPDDLKLKWPNDVLIRDRKVAGILLESGNGAAMLDWLIVGIGINIASHPDDTDYLATSLNTETDEPQEAEKVLTCVVQTFDAWLHRWEQDGFDLVRTAWLEQAKGLGQEIAVRLFDRTIHGIFQGLSAQGALCLDMPGEGQRIIPAGDVYFPGQS